MFNRIKKAAKKVLRPVLNVANPNRVLHVTYEMTGKMVGIVSISTSALKNKFCEKRSKIKGSICHECYARASLNGRMKNQKVFDQNFELLTSRFLEDVEIPIFNNLYVRFEAFGDICNEIQVRNYFRICELNTKTTFALWTKNPLIIKFAMKHYGIQKPKNLIIIFSSCMTDKAVDKGKLYQIMPYIDKIFTVWTNEKSCKAAGKEINCGNKRCIDCLNCYTKNDVDEINELLK